MKSFKISIIQGLNNKNCTKSLWLKFHNIIKFAKKCKAKVVVRFSERPSSPCYRSIIQKKKKNNNTDYLWRTVIMNLTSGEAMVTIFAY